MATEAWILEKATIGEGDELANSLAARVLLLQASIADVTAIKAVTDAIPDAGALTSISDETDKIDGAAVDGLAGVEDSVGYLLGEIERHFHGTERWWGATGAPDETNAIAATVTVPFVVTSGDNTWGAAIPICGTGDNPVLATDDKFDLHRILVTDLDDDTTPWRFRVIWGTGTSGDAITAGQYSETMSMTNAVPGNRAGGSPVDIMMRRVDVGAKCWAQCWNDTDAEELSFFYGAHGYEG